MNLHEALWSPYAQEVATKLGSSDVVLLVGGKLTGRTTTVTLLAAQRRKEGSEVKIVEAGELGEIAAGTIVVLDAPQDPDEKSLGGAIGRCLDERKWKLVISCTPAAIAGLRVSAPKLLNVCEFVWITPAGRSLITSLTSDEAADHYLLLTGGHPAFLDDVIRQGESDFSRAVERATPRLQQHYRYVYAALPDDLKRLLAACATAGKLPAPGLSLEQSEVDGLEELCRWLLVNREERVYKIAGTGFYGWLRDFVCLPSSAGRSSEPDISINPESGCPKLNSQSCFNPSSLRHSFRKKTLLR